MVDSTRRVNPPQHSAASHSSRSSAEPDDPRRALPAVAKLSTRVSREEPTLPAWAATEASRRVIAAARDELTGEHAGHAGAGRDPSDVPAGAEVVEKDLIQRARSIARAISRRHPRPVVNATGVVLHTNLGRSPLPEGAAEAVREVAAGYSDLELDLESGRRGSRVGALEAKLRELSGAQAGAVCNNNAAAVLLALDTLARGREVIVSRGELVEIGGSFRVPDIMARSGVRLVEVGTTNRTHARDYERAIGPETALLLKVHRSNFSQSGFVTEVDLAQLVEIGHERGLPVLEDLGSGTLLDLTAHGFPPESFAPSRIALGADVVCFSGDKLLGGPQAGILLGRQAAIDEMRGNPLARALRLDKMSLAALDWTLTAYLDGRAEEEIPLVRSLLADPAVLRVRAEALMKRLRAVVPGDLALDVEPDRAPVGGGSLPGFELDTWVVALRGAMGATRIAAILRGADTPVLARIRDDAVLIDLRTLSDRDAALVEAAVAGLR